MTSPTHDESRGRCAYNISLNTVQETTTDGCAAACGTARPAQQVVGRAAVDPCGPPPRSCDAATPSTGGCCEKPPARPCGRTDACEKPKSRCDVDGRAGVMNTCDETPGGGSCRENARPCDVQYDEASTPWACDANVCIRLDDGCGGYDLTPYGQQFALCTDRVVSDGVRPLNPDFSLSLSDFDTKRVTDAPRRG